MMGVIGPVQFRYREAVQYVKKSTVGRQVQRMSCTTQHDTERKLLVHLY